jgi:hypothetical protein
MSNLRQYYLEKHKQYTDKIREYEDFAFEYGSMNFAHYYPVIQKLGKEYLDFPKDRANLPDKELRYIMAYKEKIKNSPDKALNLAKREHDQYIELGNPKDKRSEEKFYKGVYQRVKEDVIRFSEWF